MKKQSKPFWRGGGGGGGLGTWSPTKKNCPGIVLPDAHMPRSATTETAALVGMYYMCMTSPSMQAEES